ncbi:MAG TPA: HDOD domain-containing protein [Gallionella sp.]|nr:HDOD domain-containing protein [Gallionella sp.]
MSKDRIGSKLQVALGNLDSLPAMPAIAQKLLALPLDTDQGEAQMLSLIEQDPQLSARIIGLANSPAMGVGRKITGIRDAAMLLGLKRLKSVAVGIATMSKLTGQHAAKNFDPQDLWSHSMTIAIVMNTVAREMPRRIRPDENQIFLTGLLHDIGFMVLHHLDFQASDELHRQMRLQPKRHIHDLELELLGVTHCHIGALLARHWHLPSEIAEVVELHHSPRTGDVELANPLVALVSVAEKLLPDFGIAEHTNEAISEDEWRELCIAPARADEISALVNELAMQVVQLPETHQVSAPAIKIAEEQAPRRPAAPQSAPPAAGKPAVESRSPIRALLGWLGGLWR